MPEGTKANRFLKTVTSNETTLSKTENLISVISVDHNLSVNNYNNLVFIDCVPKCDSEILQQFLKPRELRSLNAKIALTGAIFTEVQL